MRQLIPCAVLASALLLAPGCIIVVDHDEETHWSSDECAPRLRLGVYLDDASGATASQLGLERGRISVVARTVNGSPAETAGLKRYDVITRIDGGDASPSQVRSAIRAHKSGDEIKLTVMREGKPLDVTATLR